MTCSGTQRPEPCPGQDPRRDRTLSGLGEASVVQPHGGGPLAMVGFPGALGAPGRRSPGAWRKSADLGGGGGVSCWLD